MEHPIRECECEITSQMDFIVPLKQLGVISRSVLEAIHLFYRPRRIFVVSSKREEEIFHQVIRHWEVGPTFFVVEEDFFSREQLHLNIQDILAEYDAQREGDQREPGWWIQQLIKLGAATQIPGISDHYVVWDGDLVPMRRWKLAEKTSDGKIKYYIALLQGKARSEFNTVQYAECMKEMTGFFPIEPPNGGTFVAHHMVFNRHRCLEMIDLMKRETGLGYMPWPLIIMSFSRKFYRFSEYKTYSTFMLKFYPDEFHYHELNCFGEGGLRFREANTIVDDILHNCLFENGGISYSQVRNYVTSRLLNYDGQEAERINAPNISMNIICNRRLPGYIQLDHVYGLEGIDLNIQSPPGSYATTSPASSFDVTETENESESAAMDYERGEHESEEQEYIDSRDNSMDLTNQEIPVLQNKDTSNSDSDCSFLEEDIITFHC